MQSSLRHYAVRIRCRLNGEDSTESFFPAPEALKSMSPDAREEILTIFPEINGLDYSPRPAFQIPSGKLQKKLVARHRKINRSVR